MTGFKVWFSYEDEEVELDDLNLDTTVSALRKIIHEGKIFHFPYGTSQTDIQIGTMSGDKFEKYKARNTLDDIQYKMGDTLFVKVKKSKVSDNSSIPTLNLSIIENSERVIKWDYNPYTTTAQWSCTAILVRMEQVPFAEGAFRKAYHLQDLSRAEAQGRYVAKIGKKPSPRASYFEDVKMQMIAKKWADKYNEFKPPKKIDFLQSCVLEFVDRTSNDVICGVEPYVEGQYRNAVSANTSSGGLKPPDTRERSKSKSYEIERERQEKKKEQSSWDINSIKLIDTIKGYHNTSALCICDNQVFTGYSDNSIRVFEYKNKTLELTQTLKGHEGPVESICYNDQYLFSGSSDHSIKVWDLKKLGRCIFTLEGHDKPVHTVVVNDKYLFSGSSDKTIKIWDLKTLECKITLEGHQRAVKSLCVSGHASDDNTIKIWDIDTHRCLITLEGHNATVQCLALWEDKRYLLSCSHDQTIRLWSWADAGVGSVVASSEQINNDENR
ncbi:myosin heavy chain kinase [Heterostelium album PN500]|uniref:Myosin heavy chain kinase n=1 Tax=Heterostelium pallidum (strain ATCC 26659 / Pp 5 / PN500) TaxID=670386 RepID=D3B9J9_HETP5|nr:myosin heavy chain kinase [Heterostelium album PN500]EFA81911.1 myosin heavy chain kinase [Heterostelium album PN500]|eukprot:XP_020434028.1 myosin heavy chain kinase [Heterostelium album PN500]